jgi:hypothetical protein
VLLDQALSGLGLIRTDFVPFAPTAKCVPVLGIGFGKRLPKLSNYDNRRMPSDSCLLGFGHEPRSARHIRQLQF